MDGLPALAGPAAHPDASSPREAVSCPVWACTAASRLPCLPMCNLNHTAPPEDVERYLKPEEAMGMLMGPPMACFDVAEARRTDPLLDRSCGR